MIALHSCLACGRHPDTHTATGDDRCPACGLGDAAPVDPGTCPACGRGEDGPDLIEASLRVIDKLTREHAIALDHGDEGRAAGLARAMRLLRSYEAVAAEVDHVFLSIGKSALLNRLMYIGEPLRTRQCPEHQGRWRGIDWDGTACKHGCGLTGWLREPKPAPVVVTGLPGAGGP